MCPFIHGMLLLLLALIPCSSFMTQHAAALQAVPPSVSLSPIRDTQSGSANAININPFITNSLLQALVEESENKKRVQRYRDVACMKDKYISLPQEHFDAIQARYKVFQNTLNDVTTTPAKVFNALPRKNIEELELIREVSKELQSKKEEDAKKAAQAAANPETDKKEEKTEVKTEDVKEG